MTWNVRGQAAAERCVPRLQVLRPASRRQAVNALAFLPSFTNHHTVLSSIIVAIHLLILMEVIQSISDLKISEECAAIASTGASALHSVMSPRSTYARNIADLSFLSLLQVQEYY